MAYFEFINYLCHLILLLVVLLDVGFNTTLLPAPSAGASYVPLRLYEEHVERGLYQAITPAGTLL